MELWGPYKWPLYVRTLQRYSFYLHPLFLKVNRETPSKARPKSPTKTRVATGFYEGDRDFSHLSPSFTSLEHSRIAWDKKSRRSRSAIVGAQVRALKKYWVSWGFWSLRLFGDVFFCREGSVEYLGVWSFGDSMVFCFGWLFGSVVFFQSCKQGWE